MSDNTFIPVPLPGDPIPEVVEETVEESIQPLEGIQPEDTRPKGEDYTPERIQYLKRFSELLTSEYAPVSDMVKLMIRDLDNYTRKEITLEQIKINCPKYDVEEDNEYYPNRQCIMSYNYIRERLLELYEQEFGGE